MIKRKIIILSLLNAFLLFTLMGCGNKNEQLNTNTIKEENVIQTEESTEIESEAKTETETEIESEVETEVETETKIETEVEKETETETETEQEEQYQTIINLDNIHWQSGELNYNKEKKQFNIMYIFVEDDLLVKVENVEKENILSIQQIFDLIQNGYSVVITYNPNNIVDVYHYYPIHSEEKGPEVNIAELISIEEYKEEEKPSSVILSENNFSWETDLNAINAETNLYNYIYIIVDEKNCIMATNPGSENILSIEQILEEINNGNEINIEYNPKNILGTYTILDSQYNVVETLSIKKN